MVKFVDSTDELEQYLQNAMFDYVEAKQDAQLKEELKNNTEYHLLNQKLDSIL
ncbi:hypothetical protein IJM86_00860 [bacterium]|nr:hypothetical protein [bacterium]